LVVLLYYFGSTAASPITITPIYYMWPATTAMPPTAVSDFGNSYSVYTHSYLRINIKGVLSCVILK